MTKYRDFGSGKSTNEKEPVKFKIHDEEFSCRFELQGKTLLDLVAQSNADDPAQAARTMGSFFEKVLIDESYQRFDKLITSSDKIVSVETLAEISGWLIEVYTGRPEEEPKVS